MFTGWKITNILDVGLCELDTADGPYNKTGVSDSALGCSRALRIRPRFFTFLHPWF